MSDPCRHKHFDSLFCHDCTYEQGAAEERAAIVADLRNEASGKDPEGWGDETSQSLLNRLADRYQRGEHLRKEGT